MAKLVDLSTFERAAILAGLDALREMHGPAGGIGVSLDLLVKKIETATKIIVVKD